MTLSTTSPGDEREAFEAHIKTTSWYQVLSQAQDEDDDGASIFRMARMAAREAWQARASLSQSQGEWWKDVRVHGLPPCDGETVYVGENEAGFMGCFNAYSDDACWMDTPEYTYNVKVGAEWMPIETAPKDGRDFIALVGGLPYMAHYDEFGRMVRMTHCNRRGYGRSYTTHQIDGKALIEILSEGEDDNYEVQGILWARNFNHKPTHWMPLPSFPSMF